MNDPHRYTAISNFATALVNRFELLGKVSDLDDAIFWQNQSVEYFEKIQHPERHKPLGNLANMLAYRYQRGQEGDLDEAISLQRRALKLRPQRHAAQASSLNNLGNLLLTRFSERQDFDDDLEESIILRREALALPPPPSSDRYTSLVNLANSVQNALNAKEARTTFTR